MNQSFISCIFLMLCLPPAGNLCFARDTGAASMQIRFLSWNGQTSRPLYVKTDTDSFEPLDLRSNRRSSRIELPRTTALPLFADGQDEEGNPIKVPVAEVAIADQIHEPLLLLFDRGDTLSPPVALVFEDTEEAFPFGSYRIVNFTKHPIVFELGDASHALAPRTSALIQPKNAARENLAMRLLASIDGEVLLIRQTYWRHQPDQRMLVFAVKSRVPGGHGILLRTVAERETMYHLDVDKTTPAEPPGVSP